MLSQSSSLLGEEIIPVLHHPEKMAPGEKRIGNVSKSHAVFCYQTVLVSFLPVSPFRL